MLATHSHDRTADHRRKSHYAHKVIATNLKGTNTGAPRRSLLEVDHDGHNPQPAESGPKNLLD